MTASRDDLDAWAEDADPAAAADDDATRQPDAVLHSFAVRARFRQAAVDQDEAEAAVRSALQPVRGLYGDITVEPREPDGRWAVDVRFVVASVDGETAVEGVHTTLRDQGVTPDEAWVAERLP